MIKNLAKYKIEFLPAMAISFLLFLYLTNGQILDFTYYQWLNAYDLKQFFLGWAFFKNSDFLQNVIGLNPYFAYDLNESIVYSDSIPLVAIFFKIFAKFLPPTFQYFGLWILFCFIMQAIAATILLKKITPNFSLQFLGSLFFIFSPILIFRIFYCYHFALGAHFLILIAIILYLDKNFSQARWMWLVGISLGVHFYLFFMVFAIYLASLWQQFIIDDAKWWHKYNLLFERITIAIALILLVSWQYGYFVIGVQNASSELFGFTKMNLLSVIDSDNLWSKIISDKPQESYEYEGFAFIGIAIILMLIIAFFYEIFAPKFLRNFNNKIFVRKNLPLFIAAISLTLLALSNRISIGLNELFVLNFSENILAIFSIIRSSGRMFWPVYYLIILTAIFAIIEIGKNKFDDKETCAILLALFILQLCDMSLALQKAKQDMKNFYNNSNSFELTDKNFWQIVKNKYQKIVFLPASNYPKNFNAIAYFAASNNIKINSGLVARYSFSSKEIANQKYFLQIANGNFDNDTLYIFDDENWWIKAKNSSAKLDFIGEIDNYKILAPSYFDQ